jgi:hypothetical protein
MTRTVYIVRLWASVEGRRTHLLRECADSAAEDALTRQRDWMTSVPPLKAGKYECEILAVVGEPVDARTTQEFRDIASRRERDDERAERERGQRGRAGRVC